MPHRALLEEAAEVIRNAEALLLHTGAGMGVDSGLPDFRGSAGFWKAYPPLQHLGIRFEEMANPMHFTRDPELAWGFYGHRLNLYRDTTPHDGHQVFQRLCDDRPFFAFTSNIDGHLETAGFPSSQVSEVHGSLNWLQWTQPCGRQIWSAAQLDVQVDMRTCRATQPLPRCTQCGQIARPNVLMFGDWSFVNDRCQEQLESYRQWLSHHRDARLVIVEIGAGQAVPTVRRQSENCLRFEASRLIRINPREAQGPQGTISLPIGGLDALMAIDGLLS